jgi:ketosteroid isomerase-like protein
VTRADLARWLDGYERAWRTAGTEVLAELFTEDATYRAGPYEETARGLAAIAELWEAERESPDEPFEMTSEIVAVEGDTGVARVEVHYAATGNEYRDLWIVTLRADGRCVAFEEWPFFPAQPLGPASAGRARR